MMRLLPFLILLTSFTPAPPYKDIVHQYTIQYPEGWEEQEIDPNSHAFLSPRMDTADKFRENVNIITVDMAAKPRTLAEIAQTNRAEFVGALGSKAITLDKDLMLGGLPAHVFEYTIPANTPYNGRAFPLRFRQYTVVKGSKSYLITYTAMPESYATFLADATAAMESFKAK